MHHSADPNVLGGIFFGYQIVALFLFRGAWRIGLRTRRGMARCALSVIFILCAFAGYGSEFFTGDIVRLLAGPAHYLLLAVLIGLIVVMATGTDIFGDEE